MRVAIRTDGGRWIGGGHVMRCLTLANALAHEGAATTFFSAHMSTELSQRVLRAGHRLVQIETVQDREAMASGWDSTPLPQSFQQTDALRTLSTLGAEAYDWIIVDHYRLDQWWEQPFFEQGRKLLVLDDLANRPHLCHTLLDHSFARRAEDYVGLVPDFTVILEGTQYRLVRPEFARGREASLARRLNMNSAERLLISLGLTDVGGITAQVSEVALRANAALEIDITTGAEAACLTTLEQLAAAQPNLRLHVDTPNFAKLVSQADLCIGAGGMSVWERCCLGLPTILLVLAANQASSAAKLASTGAIEISKLDELGEKLRALVRDAEKRQRMSQLSADLCDGLGASRVAEYLRCH